MSPRNDPAPPFACDMSALASAVRTQHLATLQALFRAVVAIKELPNGYSFRLPADQSILLLAVNFIVNERLCCPFFGFAVAVDQDGGPAWLNLTGSEGIKPFIRAEIGNALRDQVAFAAGWR